MSLLSIMKFEIASRGVCHYKRERNEEQRNNSPMLQEDICEKVPKFGDPL